MNIKISKTEHDYLNEHLIESFVVGSHLYGTAKEGSDKDILCIYDIGPLMTYSPQYTEYLPNYHQFQYDDVENNRQYIYTTVEQFHKNLNSGDSTINADVIMFYPSVFNALRMCRTYNVIKAFIGFATRDLKKPEGKNKLFHAHRGLHCAASLMYDRLPAIEEINTLNSNIFPTEVLHIWCRELRNKCNKMFDNGELDRYYIPALPKSLTPQNTLLVKLLQSNNTKEFKYE